LEKEVSDMEVQKDEMSPMVIDWNRRYQYKFTVFNIHTDRYRNIGVCACVG